MQGNVVETVWAALELVVAALVLVVALNLVTLALMRAWCVPRAGLWDGVFVFAFMGAGAVVLWTVVGGQWLSAESAYGIPSAFKGSAVLLYLAGCAVYLEVKSLVARGYSLRILVDLLEAGGRTDIGTLKRAYGGGLGVEGLLLKRLQTLADAGFVRVQGDHVGPLTPLGTVAAWTGGKLRQALRLDLVG